MSAVPICCWAAQRAGAACHPCKSEAKGIVHALAHFVTHVICLLEPSLQPQEGLIFVCQSRRVRA